MRPPPPPPPRLLPTAVVGSYAVPEWLERLKTDYHQRRLSAATLDAIHDVVIKAALKDQERAGLDVVTDGELRRDNLVDHLLVRLPGVEIDRRQKAYYYDYYDAVVRGPLPQAPLGLVAEFQFAQRLTDRLVKYCLPGPHTLVKRLRDEYYGDPRALGLALARVLNAELRALVAAGAQAAGGWGRGGAFPGGGGGGGGRGGRVGGGGGVGGAGAVAGVRGAVGA